MKNVKILLRETVENLGSVGEVVEVAPGHARNYLFPKRLAIEATADNVKAMERRKARYAVELEQREADLSTKIAALGKVQLVTREKADETGTLYGSVSPALVARLLTRAGHAVNEKDVRLDEPIKSVGTFEVPIHVHGEHYAGVQLIVEADT